MAPSPLWAQDAPYTIERSAVTTLAARDGHGYRVLVAWPETPPPPAGWPVLYVLDGEDNFAIAVLTARRFARASARSGVEPGLIVAIDSGGLQRRVLDYTPAAPGYAIPQGMPAAGLATGGADAFLDFVEGKVKPMVTARWKVDPVRQTLLGHSFGGLVTLHALFTRPSSFSGYAAISPSLWFGGDVMAREESAFRPNPHTRLLIASGNAEGGPGGGSGAVPEALAARLQTAGVSARYLSLGNQGHGSTMLASMGEAVTLAFGKAPPR